MKISALTSSLPVSLDAAIPRIADLGFEWIDLPPIGAATDVAALLREYKLRVGCVALEKGQQRPLDLTAADRAVRAKSVAAISRAIAWTAEIESPMCYLTPPQATDDVTRGRWTDSLLSLADVARANSLQLCIEHFPGRLLDTAEITLNFLGSLHHDALMLLVDVGHCLISREDPATVIENSGDRLGYLHFDDNDGVSDLHWPLLTGKLKEGQIEQAIRAAQRVGYAGALCLELNKDLDDPLGNLRGGKKILERLGLL